MMSTLTNLELQRDLGRARKRRASKIEATSLTDRCASWSLISRTIATRCDTLDNYGTAKNHLEWLEDRYNRKTRLSRALSAIARFSGSSSSASDLQLFWRRHRHAV